MQVSKLNNMFTFYLYDSEQKKGGGDPAPH